MSSSVFEGRHIAFAAPPYCGHLHPVLGVALHLKSLGARCSVLTGLNKLHIVQDLGLQVCPIFQDQPDALENIANTDRRMTLSPRIMLRQVRENVNLIPKAIAETRSLFAEDKPDLVVCDFTAFPVALVARTLGIPDVTLTPSPLAIENTDGVPGYFRGLKPGNTPFHFARDFAARKLTRLAKKSFTLPFAKTLAECGFQLYRPDGSESIYSNLATFGLGMYELEFDRSWPKAFKMVGPVNFTPEASMPINLRTLCKRPMVLVTAGTHVWWAKKKLIADTSSLRAAFPHLFFVYSLGDSQSVNIDPIEKNEHFAVYSYIPYDHHLKSFCAVLHHAGTGILYQCIRQGIPALARPLDYDQFDYAARLEKRNLGVAVNSFDSRAAHAGLRRIVQYPESFDLQYFQSKLATYDAFGSIASTLATIIQAKGH